MVDSNKESGLGHLSRNIVFAKELKKKKFNIIFFVTSYFAKEAYKLFNTKKKIQYNFTYGTNKIVNEVIKILK